jgi:DNA polymerase V
MDIKSKEKIAIIDANDFYVSCERLFQPKYEKIASAVLSNNDGCFIARSQEVKDMGIKMGQPVFELENSKKDQIKMFSSNYALYGDISDRIVSILKRLVPNVEVYSIDESFLDLSHIPEEKILDEINNIRTTVQRLTGIPVSIGVAPNKTLAKLCNHISKTNKEFNGACSYWSVDKSLLHQLDIDEVWGIGRKYRKRLFNIDVKNVEQFMNLGSNHVRNMLKIVGLRTWYELHESLCYPIQTKFKTPKMITCSRTYGKTVWQPTQIKNSFWTFLSTCHKKLIKENLGVNQINLFATTNRFDDNYFSWSKSIRLNEQTQSIDDIWNQIVPHLDEMPVRLYYRAGISMSRLKPKNIKQVPIFKEKSKSFDKPIVEEQIWQTRRDFLSSEYTTSWDELPLAF